jgi:hypothetical protein
MGKILHILTCACLVLLLFGTAWFPDSSAFWLASSTNFFEYMRGVLLCVLVVQLVTKPPRNIYFRLAYGMLATAVGAWALKATYDAQMEALDSLSLLAAAIAIGVTALELRPASKNLEALSSKPATILVVAALQRLRSMKV